MQAHSESNGATLLVGFPRSVAALLLLTPLAVFALHLETVLELELHWREFDQESYFVVAICAYFIWLSRDRLHATTIVSQPIWLLPLAAVGLAWAAGTAVSIQIVGQLAMPLLIALSLCAIVGLRFVLQIAIPILLLYVTIPIWNDAVNDPLRVMTANAVRLILQAFAFPAHMEGYRIDIPYGSFYVAAYCSGLKFLLTGLTISVAFSFLNFHNWRKVVLFVLICAAISILSNWIRVLSLVLIGYYSQMQSPLITGSHIMFGWYIFAGAMLLMLIIGHFMARNEPFHAPATVARQGVIRPLVVAGTLLALGLGPALIMLHKVQQTTVVNDLPLPNAFASPTTAVEWQPSFSGYDVHAQGISGPVQLDVMLYPNQTQSKELISSVNRFEDEKDFHIRASNTRHAAGLTFQELNVAGPEGERLVWYWYLVAGKPVLGQLRAKWDQLTGLISTGRSDAALISYSIPCAFNCDHAREQLAATVAATAEQTVHNVESSLINE